MQMKHVHPAARKLPAQLNLKRMPHVVVNDDSEGPSAAWFAVAREFHALCRQRCGARQLPLDCGSGNRAKDPAPWRRLMSVGDI